MQPKNKEIKVLIFHPESNIRNTLKEILEYEGYYLKITNSANEANEIVQNEKFHIFIVHPRFFEQTDIKLNDTTLILITGYLRQYANQVPTTKRERLQSIIKEYNIQYFLAPPMDLNYLLDTLLKIYNGQEFENEFLEFLQ